MRCCTIAGVLFCTTVRSQQQEFAVIRERITADLVAGVNSTALTTRAGGYMASLQSNGAWADIDYASKAITSWMPAQHLERVQEMAIAYMLPGSSLQGLPALHSSLVAALRYWGAHDYRSSNWWHNEIKAPQTLGEILLLLNQGAMPLPVTLRDSLLLRMQRGNMFKQAGANKLDVALHHIYRACITEDTALMRVAVAQVFQPVAFTQEEGLQCDYSNLQHGPQLYISGYGAVFLLGEYKVAAFLAGTPYALAADRLQLLSRFLHYVYLKTLRGAYIDFNVEGRSVSRPGSISKKKLTINNSTFEVNGLFNLIAKAEAGLDADAAAALERMKQTRAADYGVTPYHNHFWRADYTMHLRPAYSFHVRTVSIRTRRTESGNGENLLGKFMADGATNIQRRGDEYYNIMPVWEWDKIPGTTSHDYIKDQPATVQWGEPGSTAFAGGVSDSVYGVTAYDMQYDSVNARKAWFFGDSAVVCLGAGITAGGAEPVVTTVNQCWLKGKVRSSGKATGIAASQWVWHDSIGYFFPAGGNVALSSKKQSGSWKRINNTYSAKEVSGEVFSLWLNHGTHPANAGYAYIVVPGIGRDAMKVYTPAQLQIVANSDTLQAVWNSRLRMLQAVFYKAGEISINGLRVTVSTPCVLLLKNNGGQLTGYVSDPTQQAKTITVAVEMPAAQKRLVASCPLPQGCYAGASAAFTFQEQ